MKKILLALSCVLLGTQSPSFAANFDAPTVDNGISAGANIKSTGGSIFTTGGSIYMTTGNIYTTAPAGFIKSQTYLEAGSYVRAGTLIQALGGAVTAGTDVQAGNNGLFGNSVRVGNSAVVPAARSLQLGDLADASFSYNTLVVGKYNKLVGTSASPTAAPASGSWSAVDPVLVVGNGATAADRGNALTVYKDGTFELPGKFTVDKLGVVKMTKRQGDVGMGQYGNPGDQ